MRGSIESGGGDDTGTGPVVRSYTGHDSQSEFALAWPPGIHSPRLIGTFYVEDRAATEVRVLAAGATKYDFQPNDDHCTVFADPAGHAFCLSTWGKPN